MHAANTILLDFCKARDVHAALGVVLKGIAEETDWAIGKAWLPTREQTGLACSPGWHVRAEGLDEFRVASTQLLIRDDDEIPGAVWASERAMWVDEARTFAGPRQGAVGRAGLQAAIGLPLADGGQVVGVLELFARKPRRRDEKLLRAAAATAADVGALVRARLAEEAARRREERLEKLLLASTSAVWEWDLAAHRMAWGSGIRSSFGYSLHEVSTDPMWRAQRIHPHDRARVTRSLEEAIATGRASWSETYRFLDANGAAVGVLDRAVIVLGDRNEPAMIVGSMTTLDRLVPARAAEVREQVEAERSIGVVHRPNLVATNGHARAFADTWAGPAPD
jgi:PAS domain-containing protein